jgi:hypothetical protein
VKCGKKLINRIINRDTARLILIEKTLLARRETIKRAIPSSLFFMPLCELSFLDKKKQVRENLLLALYID